MNKPKLDPNDMRTYPVQKSPCLTCPFAGKEPLMLSDYEQYIENLMGKGQHICHSTQENVCRGGRDIQLQWLYFIGRLDEPTDVAFVAKRGGTPSSS